VTASLRQRLDRWVGTRADDDVLRVLFGIVLVAAAGALAVDYQTLGDAGAKQQMVAPEAAPAAVPGIGPSAEPLPSRDSERGRPAPLRKPDPQLQNAMSFDLQSGGRLIATGTIMPGTAKAFADEIEKRGGYVNTVVLHSPGGSLQDALAIGRLIRARKFSTAVDDGRYCASACPLVFASGVERKAGAKAAVGVHRAVTFSDRPAAERDGMEDGQRISALAQKYLREMGIDLEVWIHAMETPNDRLYYFKSDELLGLKLATQVGDKKAAPDAKAKS
jgi:hypothetical protein